MKHRGWLGLALTLHGLAHTAAGMAAQDTTIGLASVLPPGARVTLATGLFAIASCGFVAAGFGVWGVAPLTPRWRPLVYVASVASVLLLVLFGTATLTSLLGLALDAAAVLVAARSVPRDGEVSPARPGRRSPRRVWRVVARLTALSFLAYLGILVLTRPWHRDWGSTTAERVVSLPGDERSGNPARAGDRAVAIAAPAEEVWPWLLQIGEDRGGFYSHAWLENLFGLHIVNAERIEPAWQTLETGDFVRAVPPDWMGGLFGDRIGWEVDQIDTSRHVLALRYWIFEVETVDARKSRLHVRTHAGDAPVFAAPMMLLGFEPAHFVMERAMLLGIRDRAERRHGAEGSGS